MTSPTNDWPDATVLDFREWRGVLTGLNLFRFASLALVVGAVSFFCLIPVAFQAGTSWLGQMIRVGAICFFPGCGIVFCIGLGYCCTAPHSQARRYALAAVVVAAVGVLGTILYMTWQWMLNSGGLPRGWLVNLLARLNDFAGVFLFILLVNAIVAVATWFRFLQAVAEALRAPALAYNIHTFIFWFCALAIVFSPIMFLWGASLIQDTRNMLKKAVESRAPMRSPVS